MRVLITGGGGMLGGHLARALLAGGHEVHTVDRHDRGSTELERHVAELSTPGAVAAVVDAVRPDLTVHTAYSMEDLERDVVAASLRVAEACRDAGSDLIHISTDAVFDGESAPYAEADEPRPVHPYGRAKRQVEVALRELLPGATVVRTSLIAHLDPAGPDSATAWVVDANRAGREVTLFTDEVRTVVRLVDLVEVLAGLVARSAPERGGIWHVAGPDRLSRADLGELIADVFGLDRSLIRHAPAASVPGPRPRDVSLLAGRVAHELSVVMHPVATVPGHGQAIG